MEVARANRAVPPRIILDLSSICYTDRLGTGLEHGGAIPNAKEKVRCTSAYHHHYIDHTDDQPIMVIPTFRLEFGPLEMGDNETFQPETERMEIAPLDRV